MRPGRCPQADFGGLKTVQSQDVEDRFPSGDQIIGDNSPMTTPPYSLRAHDCRWGAMAEITQPRKTFPKSLAHRVVGIIVEALILPECIYLRRHTVTDAT